MSEWSEVLSVWLRDLGVWLYNFYFLALVFVLSRLWFLAALGGFVAILVMAVRDERALRVRIGRPYLGEPSPGYTAAELQRRRR